MISLEATALGMISPLISLWESFVEIFPSLVAALIVLIIGYFIALLLGHIVRVLLVKAGADRALKKVTPSTLGKIKTSDIFSVLTKWFVFIIFIQAAADIVNLGGLSVLLNEFVAWLPHLIFGIIAVFVGLFVAHYVGEVVQKHATMKWSKLLAGIIKVTIVFIGAVIGLEQIGIEVSILEGAFLILLGAFAFGAALAIGLSFGLGLKGKAPQMWDNLKKKF